MPRKKKKKTRQEKWKKRRGEKAKRNSQDCYVTVKPIGTLLPAYAQTNKKAAKCRTCEGLCGMFYLLTARQWPENGSTCFPEKFPGVNRLISAPQFWTDYSSYFQSEKKKTNLGELVSRQQRQRFIFRYLYLELILTNIIIRRVSGTSHNP